jgi:hypothetical protein
MPSGRPNGLGAPRPRLLATLQAPCLALALALALAAPSEASDAPDAGPDTGVDRGVQTGSSGPWFSVGLLTGSTQFDAGLADYQWDTTPRLGWGVKAVVGRGRLDAGIRVWRTSSMQSIGDLGESPVVHATSWEVIGEGRVAEVLGTEVLVTAGAGRLHLGYAPDRITILPPGSGPIEVDLAPVGSWSGAGGLALRREVAARWAVGLGVDARVWAIDTAHRAGSEIVYARESFGDWSARCELAWLFRRR